jgi:UDP-N-acetylglucosamine acyltransferase
VIADLPQDLAFEGGESYVRIGDRVIIREGVTIHRGTKPDTSTIIGDECFLMGFSHFAHNVKLGRKVIVVNGSLLAGYVEVDDGAFISGNVSIHQFCRVGKLAMMGGMSGVSKDIPPFCTAASLERNRVSGLNTVGLKRAGYKPDQRKAIKRAFDLLYRESLDIATALERIRQEVEPDIAEEFCSFIEGSTRGICGIQKPGILLRQGSARQAGTDLH